MKKILLGFALLTVGLAKAQLTESNHAPTSGDVFSTVQCDSTGVIVGASGAGATWDFSTLVTHNSLLNNYTSSVSTNTSNLGYLEVKSSISNSSYYSSTPGNLSYYGGNITAGAINATVNYTTPAIVAIYPMSLNSTTTNITGGNAIVPPFGNATFTGTCNVIADGTGTLVLAGRTFTNAIRLITTQNLNVNSGAANVTLVNYDYYSIADSKRPIVTISTSTLSSLLGGTSTQSVVTIQPNNVILGLNDNHNAENMVSVFPNPSTSNVNFTTLNKDANKIIIFDLAGKMITETAFENFKATVNVGDVNPGIYFYSILNENNHVLIRGKFTVGK